MSRQLTDVMAGDQSGRISGENRKTSQLTRRSASCTCATKVLSFVAVDSSATSSNTSNAAQRPEAAATAVATKGRPDDAPQWGSGVGWKKLTERGKLIVSPNSGGCLTVEGCTVGFCVASYEGTKEEQTILNGGKYAVEAVIKVSPGGVFDGQAMCVVFDMAKASDVSGACDLCSLQLNTSSRTIRLESLIPGIAPRALLLVEEVPFLTPNTWIHVAIHYACNACSVWVNGECVRQHLKLSRPHPSFPPYDDFYTNTVGVAVYGKTRMQVKSFKILQLTQLQATDCSGKEVPRHPLAAPCPGALWPPLLTEGEGGGADTQEAELTRMVEREMLVSHPPGISLQDVVALTTAKEILTEVVLLPLQMPGIFKGLLQPPKGVLLFGPPGTGKTMLATALASVAEVSFFCCSAATLTSKWRGESEKLLRALFRTAKARAPSLIFIDEADALCSQRGREDEHEASRRFKAEMLQQIDSLNAFSLEHTLSDKDRVVVLAATNAPWDIDEALRRRLEKRVLLPLPDLSTRQQLLQHLLKQQQVDDNLDFEHLARKTDGFSCADLRTLCREAAMQPVRRLLRGAPPDALVKGALKADDIKQPVTADDFEIALKITKPSVSKETALRYVKWNEVYGST